MKVCYSVNQVVQKIKQQCFCFAALASLGYEKTCVLFNAAALASQIASEQNLDNDEGLKAAAKYYQVGAPPHSCIDTCRA